ASGTAARRRRGRQGRLPLPPAGVLAPSSPAPPRCVLPPGPSARRGRASCSQGQRAARRKPAPAAERRSPPPWRRLPQGRPAPVGLRARAPQAPCPPPSIRRLPRLASRSFKGTAEGQAQPRPHPPHAQRHVADRLREGGV